MEMSNHLVDLRKIWDRAPHNAMTDLLRYQDSWICVFREGTNHVSPDGRIRIIVSRDGTKWASAAVLSIPGLDLRDPKITLTPSGRLMINAAAAYPTDADRRHQSYVWFSTDGKEWREPTEIGHPDCWLWRVTWQKAMAYGVGYRTVEPLGVHLYAGTDGLEYDILVENLFVRDFPNEASIAFRENASALCLLRRDGGEATAKIGIAQFPYKNWTWKDLGARIGGPHLIVLPEGRIVAAVRRYGKSPWTSLNWLDPVEGKLKEFLALSSGGDTSYAGLCWHDDILWVSYYSSHEQKASIYLAKVKPPQ